MNETMGMAGVPCHNRLALGCDVQIQKGCIGWMMCMSKVFSFGGFEISILETIDMLDIMYEPTQRGNELFPFSFLLLHFLPLSS